MEKDLLKFSSGEGKQDIQAYLVIPIEHLNKIILEIKKLSENESEKEHLIDILKECFYYNEELLKLQSDYLAENLFDKKQTILNNIKISVKNIFNIEEELISDYPDIFSNNDDNWSEFNYLSTSVDIYHKNSELKTNSLKLKKKKNNFKELAFGLFFLFPAFLLVLFYPLLNNKIKLEKESKSNLIVSEYDRAYKNLFYIYSAVVLSKNTNDNFYTLIKTNSFKIPEGFVVIDKNVIADYYLKEYYRINSLEDNLNVTILSVSNVNYIQCKYIVTKFSNTLSYTVEINSKDLTIDDLSLKNKCLPDSQKSNTVSLNIIRK